MEKQTSQYNISFDGLGIAPRILEILDRMRFIHPTPIQHKAIPIGIEGKDVIGVAQTGTGKTLAFAIPIIQHLLHGKGRSLILVPTRELALQISETFLKIAPSFGIRTAVIIGGTSINTQLAALRKHPRVIIATPGRLVDHIERRTVLLADISVLVLDEADRMLDMGFMPQIGRILKVIPKHRQTMLFSATIPGEVIQIAARHMKFPVHIEVAPSGTTAEDVAQELFIVKKNLKRELLLKLLERYRGAALVFSRTKIGARKISRFLKTEGHSAAEIHSDRSLNQRTEALEGFKTGKHKVLVATDIAARGIDIVGIEVVFNYDIPEDTENYVHRIGRTGRAGHKGLAISFATPEQGGNIRGIEKLIKTVLPVVEHPDFPREKFTCYSSNQPRHSHFYTRKRRKQKKHKQHHQPQRYFNKSPKTHSAF